MSRAAPPPPGEPTARESRRRPAHRRANGEGTITQRKDGRYEVKAFVLDHGRPDGAEIGLCALV